jgi:hypothetical protein
MLCGNTLILHDGNPHLWQSPTVDGDTKTHGLVPRDYSTHPVGCYAGIRAYHAVDMPLIPQSEWSQRLKDLTAAGARLSDIRRRGWNGKPIPSRDQNGRGYCWAHSGVSAHLVVRARDGQPYVDLSAYAIACQIKSFADEGGWGAQGVDWQIANGVPTSKTWPQQSTNRDNVNDAMKAESALHKIDEGWIDLASQQWDRNLAWNQFGSCSLSGDPDIRDYNWWSHSVCGLDLVEGTSIYPTCRNEYTGKLVTLQEFEVVWDMQDPVTAGFGCRILNSWGDSWSDLGEGILPPQKAVPDGGVALRTVTASAV